MDEEARLADEVIVIQVYGEIVDGLTVFFRRDGDDALPLALSGCCASA